MRERVRCVRVGVWCGVWFGVVSVRVGVVYVCVWCTCVCVVYVCGFISFSTDIKGYARGCLVGSEVQHRNDAESVGYPSQA